MSSPGLRVYTAAALLFATQAAHAGVIIGNPPQARWSITASTGGGESFSGTVAWVDLRARDGSHTQVPGASNVEFAAGWQPLFPVGDWVHLTLVFDGPLTSCTPNGCHTVSVASLDLDPASPDDLVLRGVIIGNPPLQAIRVR